MIKVYIETNRSWASTDIYIVDEDESGKKRMLAAPCSLVFSEFDPAKIVQPTFRFSHYEGAAFLKEMANALIESGFRDKAADKNGEVLRMEAHLQDLRKIVFKALKIE
jgi:hypothetical protein